MKKEKKREIGKKKIKKKKKKSYLLKNVSHGLVDILN